MHHVLYQPMRNLQLFYLWKILLETNNKFWFLGVNEILPNRWHFLNKVLSTNLIKWLCDFVGQLSSIYGISYDYPRIKTGIFVWLHRWNPLLMIQLQFVLFLCSSWQVSSVLNPVNSHRLRANQRSKLTCWWAQRTGTTMKTISAC